MRESQRHGRDSGLAFGELGIDRPCNLYVRVSFFEIAAANIGRVGNGRPNTQRSAAARLDPISARDELDFGGAQLVVHMESKLRVVSAALGDAPFVARLRLDLQLRSC